MTYSVTVDAGPYSWTCTEGDEPGFGLADGLTLRWQVDSESLRPSQPSPLTAQFSLVLDDLADLADLELGSPVAITVTLDTATPADSTSRFYGRVSEMTAEPRTMRLPGRGSTPIMLVDVAAADYTADLAEIRVGATAMVSQQTQYRVENILNRADLGPATWTPLPTGGGAVVDRRDPDPQAALNLVNEYLDQYVVEDESQNDVGLFRYIIAPDYNPTDQRHVGWQLSGLGHRIDTEDPDARLPGRLVRDPDSGLVILEVPADPSTAALDACTVDLGVEWNRYKARTVNTVVVAGNYAPFETPQNPDGTGAVTVTNRRRGQPTISEQVEVSLRYPYAATLLGSFHLPDDTAVRDSWSLDTITWHLHADPAGRAHPPPLFHDHSLIGTGPNVYVRPWVIVGIPPEQCPSPNGWYVGQPLSVSLDLTAGRPTVTVELAYGAPRAAQQTVNPLTFGYAAWIHLATALDQPTWNDLDPRFSWFEYRLAARPTT